MAYLRGLMMRSMVPLFALLGACTVGEAPGSDGGGSGGGSNTRNVCVDRMATPTAAYNHTTAPTGPRAGLTCLDAACHIPAGGGGSTPFAFAGTVYKDAGAQAPAAGVAVRIFKGDSNPNDDVPLATAITDSAGNFVIRNPGDFGNFPYDTHVTACGSNPEQKPMLSAVTAAEANCNIAGSCHGAGGTAGVIDLPDPI